MQETHAVLRAQPGFARDYVLERVNAPDGVEIAFTPPATHTLTLTYSFE